MKKILAFLTKGSKIRRILVYVYRGLVVADAAFKAGFEAIKIERPEDKAYAKLEGIPEYLEAAAKAIKTIISWLGADVGEIEEAVNREVALTTGVPVENQALKSITDNLNTENK